MKRKPKRSVPPSQRPHRISTPEGRIFRDAMEAPEPESTRIARRVIKGEHACTACGSPNPECIGRMILAGQFARECGVLPGRQLVLIYQTCEMCARKCTDGDQYTQELVEASIMARLRGNNVRFDADGMPIVEPVHLPPLLPPRKD